jgi:uncharacterized membrane protein
MPEGVTVRTIVTVTRHRLMWRFALWALAHLSPDGDATTVIFFGRLALLSFAGISTSAVRRPWAVIGGR